MLGFGLKITNLAAQANGVGAFVNWILRAGAWNDALAWNDAQAWKDS
jgi:hypothetical protein